MPTTHVYRHPEGKGLGRHHADAEGRERFDAEAAASRGLTTEEIEIIAAEHDRHAKLDLAHGTEIEFDYVHPDTGLYHVTWTDFFGTSRMTSIDPEVFAEMFEEHPDYAGPCPTHSSVQEHDYHRGTFGRPDHRPELRTVSVPADVAASLASAGEVHADHGLLGAVHDPALPTPDVTGQVARHGIPVPEGTDA